MSYPAVFLDRDGTINVEKSYVHHAEQWEWLPGALEGIRAFNTSGYRVIVVSNQSGIARGFYRTSDVERLHSFVNGQLVKAGAHVDAFYYCPHHSNWDGQPPCACRKPLPGMLFQAQKDWDLDFGRSYIIGDRKSDLEAGLAAGVTPILVLSGFTQRHDLATTEWIQGRKYYIASSILRASEMISEGKF